jgi:hypothetical protein
VDHNLHLFHCCKHLLQCTRQDHVQGKVQYYNGFRAVLDHLCCFLKLICHTLVYLLRYWLCHFNDYSLDECSVIWSAEVLRTVELSHHNVFPNYRNLVKMSEVGLKLHVALFETDALVSKALLSSFQGLFGLQT